MKALYKIDPCARTVNLPSVLLEMLALQTSPITLMCREDGYMLQLPDRRATHIFSCDICGKAFTEDDEIPQKAII